jgi:choline dehydrogenase-like flavoprotein
LLRDARTVSPHTPIRADVCIVGAGAAGITLARRLADTHLEVALVESGGLEFDADSQSLYRGENVGAPYFLLDTCRMRQFGGSTNHWHGLLGRLDEQDFAEREWIPHSGWPFSRTELEPYYEAARDVLGLGDGPFDVTAWEDRGERARLPVGERLSHTVALFSPPVRFGHRYRDELVASRNVTVYTFANVTELVTDENARRVISARVACLDGPRFTVEAGTFVLACGGIENARLLLLSDAVIPQGLGNQHDLVGRFFMEHPMKHAGIFHPADPALSLELYAQPAFGSVLVQTALVPSRKIQEERRLSHVSLLMVPTRAKASAGRTGHPSDGLVAEAAGPGQPNLHDRQVRDGLEGVRTVALRGTGATPRIAGLARYEQVVVLARAEQIPNPQSRVTLAPERDALGCRRVRLDWRLVADDQRSTRESLDVLTEVLGAAGLGRMKYTISEDDASWLPPRDRWPWAGPLGANHHMGTTRMANDPKRGVADASARVHGVENLYVAGSSVFPTSGHTPPTMTLVALSLRLADHLRGRLL